MSHGKRLAIFIFSNSRSLNLKIRFNFGFQNLILIELLCLNVFSLWD